MSTAARIADVEARLSEFVRPVKADNEVVITERGIPVARFTGLDVAQPPACFFAPGAPPPRRGRDCAGVHRAGALGGGLL